MRRRPIQQHHCSLCTGLFRQRERLWSRTASLTGSTPHPRQRPSASAGFGWWRAAFRSADALRPSPTRCSPTSPSRGVLMPRAFRLRRFEREWPRGKPLDLRLMFGSAVRTLKAHQIGPDAGQGRIVNVNLKINRLSGLWAPTNEITHRVARKSQKKRATCSQPCCLIGFIARAKRGPNNLRITGAAPRRHLSLSTVSMWRIRSPTTSIRSTSASVISTPAN
jgi:hypothetical protein